MVEHGSKGNGDYLGTEDDKGKDKHLVLVEMNKLTIIMEVMENREYIRLTRRIEEKEMKNV